MTAAKDFSRPEWHQRFYVGEDRQEAHGRCLGGPLTQFVATFGQAESQRDALLPSHPGAYVIAISGEDVPDWPADMLAD